MVSNRLNKKEPFWNTEKGLIDYLTHWVKMGCSDFEIDEIRLKKRKV